MDVDLCSRSSPTKKKRKRSSCPTHPVLKDAVKSCVAAICSDSKKEGFFDGKELCLIQLPKHLDPKQLDGQKIKCDSTAQPPCIDCCSKNYEINMLETNTKALCDVGSLLQPSYKAGRLKAGPELSKYLTIHQTVLVPEVDLSIDDHKSVIEMPCGLKQRWKPFGYKEPYLVSSDATAECTLLRPHKRKHKKKRLKGCTSDVV